MFIVRSFLTSFIEFSLYLTFYYLAHIYFFTIRYNLSGVNNVKKPSFFFFWHGKMLPLIYIFRNRNVYVLVSLSRDGEIAKRILRLFGFKTIRGSSSKGGFKGLIELLQCYKRKNYIAITPDGPRGPKGKFEKRPIQFLMNIGDVYCIQVKGKGIRLKTWDSFFIPYPFSRLYVNIKECKKIENIKEDMGEL